MLAGHTFQLGENVILDIILLRINDVCCGVRVNAVLIVASACVGPGADLTVVDAGERVLCWERKLESSR